MNTVKKKAAPKKRAPRVKKELAIEQSNSLATVHQINPIQVSPIEQMRQMHEIGVSVADMKDMLALQREYEAGEALKAFNVALAAFKAEDIQIFKKKQVSFENSKGDTTAYKHATLDDIVAITTPYLSKHGFSHRWRPTQSDGGMIKITFILTHEQGHSEETSLQAGLDQSGGKNNIQAMASTVSYLERYTFLAGTGLAVKDMDNDGVLPEGADGVERITDGQLADMTALIEEVGSTVGAFALYCKLDSLENMPASKYHAAIQALEGKRP